MKRSILFIMVWWLTAPFATVQATDVRQCTAKTGERTVPLIELYTSEGCSSCPPADHWLSTLRSRGLAPTRVVPLALHVDYWDTRGWKDRYAQKIFSDRQYWLADLSRIRTVYTPQVVLNGRDFPHWHSQTDAAIERINAIPARANIALTLARGAGRIDITADAQSKDRDGHTGLYLAVYENNLSRHVNAGENRGLTLHHDYVVRRLLGPVSLDKNGRAHFTQALALDRAWKENNLGIAAFVQDTIQGNVLQALAMPLCR
ncbi:MAG: DUF1223 domain-containing protein [Sulfuricaulis sp.]